MSELNIELQAGHYGGQDPEAGKAFREIQSNWPRLKKWLVEGGTPPLLAKVNTAYSTGYGWVEVYQKTDGTFATVAGGRQSGVGGYPKAFEQNGGVSEDYSTNNVYVELILSSDITSHVLTLSFDASSPRIAAKDQNIITGGSWDSGTRKLTLARDVLQRDVKNRVIGIGAAADVELTIDAGAGGSFDAYQEAVLVEAGVTKLSIPTDNLTSDVLEFVDDAGATEVKLRFKSGASDRMVLQWDSTAGGVEFDFIRGHP